MIPPALVPWLVRGVIAAGLLVAGFGIGAKYVYIQWLEEKGRQATEAVKIVTRQGTVTERVVARWKEREAKIQTVTVETEKEVVRYVPAAADVVLPLGWRVLHDAAAAGTVPETPAGTDVSAPSVTGLAAAKTVVINYGAAHTCQAQLEELQDWVREQYETMNQEPLRW